MKGKQQAWANYTSVQVSLIDILIGSTRPLAFACPLICMKFGKRCEAELLALEPSLEPFPYRALKKALGDSVTTEQPKVFYEALAKALRHAHTSWTRNAERVILRARHPVAVSTYNRIVHGKREQQSPQEQAVSLTRWAPRRARSAQDPEEVSEAGAAGGARRWRRLRGVLLPRRVARLRPWPRADADRSARRAGERARCGRALVPGLFGGALPADRADRVRPPDVRAVLPAAPPAARRRAYTNAPACPVCRVPISKAAAMPLLGGAAKQADREAFQRRKEEIAERRDQTLAAKHARRIRAMPAYGLLSS